MENIYGQYKERVEGVMDDLLYKLNGYNNDIINAGGDPVFDHISARIKSDRSMREKLARLGLAVTPEMALSENVHDAVGVRIVTCFIDDIFENIKQIRALKGVTVLEEKDYLTNAKPNGYRSYHLIISIEEPFEDAAGATPGMWYAEIQLRTIAMDSWAVLEHRLKYKKQISDTALIVAELKRVADELASCDVSMQTIRDMIKEIKHEDSAC